MGKAPNADRDTISRTHAVFCDTRDEKEASLRSHVRFPSYHPHSIHVLTRAVITCTNADFEPGELEKFEEEEARRSDQTNTPHEGDGTWCWSRREGTSI